MVRYVTFFIFSVRLLIIYIIYTYFFCLFQYTFWTVINTLYILNFDRKYKFSNKNNTVSAWVNFKNIFPRPLFIIIFRPEMLKFHSYCILTGDTRAEFVIHSVLRRILVYHLGADVFLKSHLSF